MTDPVAALSHLTNPLATVEQLAVSSSVLDGIPADLERSIRYAGVRLIQAAGILLQVPQDVIGTGIVLFTRCLLGQDGCSLRQYSARDLATASLFLAAKLSAYPQSPRNVINVFALLIAQPDLLSQGAKASQPEPSSYFLSEGTYIARRNVLLKLETIILRVCGFQTHVSLPYTLAINYMQALDVLSTKSGLARRTFQHLTSSLHSPQLLLLTHQPNALAVSAIYLAAREKGVVLPDGEWWEVFGVDREELGFLVVALCSMPGFVEREKQLWRNRLPPMSVSDVEAELSRRRSEAEKLRDV